MRFSALLTTAILMIAQQPARAEEEPMGFVGRTIVISYDSGLQVEAQYKSATELTWRALTGPEQGREGTETIHAVEVAPDVFFISWLERSGVSVSNVVDFRSNAVFAFVTFEAEGARRSMADKGTFRETTSAAGD